VALVVRDDVDRAQFGELGHARPLGRLYNSMQRSCSLNRLSMPARRSAVTADRRARPDVRFEEGVREMSSRSVDTGPRADAVASRDVTVADRSGGRRTDIWRGSTS
jgi:hypothetical protein